MRDRSILVVAGIAVLATILAHPLPAQKGGAKLDTTWDLGLPVEELVVPTISSTPIGLSLIPASAPSDLLVVGNTLYAAGGFTQVGNYTCSLALADLASGQVETQLPFVHGRLFRVVSDGAGGWFFGGEEFDVDGAPRHGLAHLAADGSLSPFAPQLDGAVHALAVSGSTLYVGGEFRLVDGEVRHGLAAFDTTTGALSSWDPTQGEAWGPNEWVFDLVVDGAALYVAGNFSHVIGGAQRNYVASLDATTGSALAWNPDPDGSVFDLDLLGRRLALAGGFATIAGQARDHIAVFDNLVLTPTNADIKGGVSAVSLTPTTLYFGGSLYDVNNTFRHNGAALNLATNSLIVWDPVPDQMLTGSGFVERIVAVPGAVYICGDFISIRNQRRLRLAATNPATGVPLPWTCDISGAPHEVHDFAMAGGKIAVAGNFEFAGGERRDNIAAWDLTTGQLLPFAPVVDPGTNSFPLPGAVHAIEADGTKLYLGGMFAKVNGVVRNHFAALDLGTGSVDPQFVVPGQFHPTDNWVRHLELGKDRLFAAGRFVIAAGAMDGMAAVDPVTGALAPNWTCGGGQTVQDMLVSQDASSLFVAGTFGAFGIPAVNVRGVASIDPANGAVRPWNALLDEDVWDVQLAGTTLFCAGQFGFVGGTPRRYVAQIEQGSAALWPWDAALPNLGPSAQFWSVARYRLALFMTTDEEFVLAGQIRNGIAAVNARTAELLPWDPQPSRPPTKCVVLGQKLIVFGPFETISGIRRPRVALYTLSDSLP